MYEKHIEVIASIRKAFEKFKHYKEFSKRMKPFLEAELPGYTVYLVDNTIKVWGNGIDYDNCVYVTWSNHVRKGGVYEPLPWQDGLLQALEVADHRDYAERQQHEEALLPQLEKLNAEVQDRIRAARILIENLPVPMSATVRKEPFHWTSPSMELRNKFPALFKEPR